MMKIFYALVLCSVLALSCNLMNDVTLYDFEVALPDPIASFPYHDIYTDSHLTDIKGLKNAKCKQVFFETENSYLGQDHLHIQWDQNNGCKYMGIIFPWSNFKGKNIAAIVDYAAIEFMIRVDQGTFTKLPMFFAMLDYGGKQCNSKINYLGIEGGIIDSEWRRILIPLKSFNYQKKSVNLANIKELRLEFQQSGDVHIDEMKIVAYKDDYQVTATSFVTIYDKYPIQIGNGKEYWWGINAAYSDNFDFISDVKTWRGREALSVDIQMPEDKSWNQFGFAVSAWNRMDISSIYSTSALRFSIKASEMPKVQIMLVSYSGAVRRIQKVINESNILSRKDGMLEVLVPLKSFHKYDDFDWSSFKEIRFKVIETSMFEMGSFGLVEFRGNPLKPNQWKGL